MNKLIIDKRMREIEKNKLKELGYELLEINSNKILYPEISSHVDIFCTKIKNNLIVENSQYNLIKENVKKEIKVIQGLTTIGEKYPEDIKYNVCIVGNCAIHNFNYTDRKIQEVLKKEKYSLINVKQGYSKCSIAVIDENSLITADEGIYNKLKRYNFDILFIDYKLNIKLLNEKGYSPMKGFIGGAISRIGNKVFISGDIEKIDKNKNIKKFIQKKGLEVISFDNLEVIDYGGIIEI